MAAVTHRVATASTSNATSYASGAFTPAVGDLLVAFVGAAGTVATGTMTGTGAGQSFTKVTSFVGQSSVDTLYVFVSNILTTAAASQTVTFLCTGDAGTGATVEVFSVSGMTRTGLSAILQSAGQNNQASGGTPTVTFGATTLTGNVIAGAVANATSPATLTPPTNFTEQNDTGFSTPTTGIEYATRASGHTSTTVTWGGTSPSAFCSVAIELDTSGWALMETLTDDFNTNVRDATKWQGYSTSGNGTLVNQNQRMEYSTGTTISSSANLTAQNLYDLTGSYIFCQIVDPGSGSVVSKEFTPCRVVDAAAANGLFWLLFTSAGANFIRPYKKVATTNTALGSSLAYNSTTMAWLRIRESSGTTFWDYSADGVSWTNYFSVANPVTVTALRPDFFVDIYAAETTPASIFMDNVNTVPAVAAARFSGINVYNQARRVRASNW